MTEQVASIPLENPFVGKIIIGGKEIKIRVAPRGGFNAVILSGDFTLMEKIKGNNPAEDKFIEVGNK